MNLASSATIMFVTSQVVFVIKQITFSLSTAQTLIDAAFAKGQELGLKPLSVVVLDPRASMVAVMSQDGVAFSQYTHSHTTHEIEKYDSQSPLFLSFSNKKLVIRFKNQHLCTWILIH